MQLVNHFTQTD